MEKKTREQLIAEGRPYIQYEKGGKTYTQLFLTPEAMHIRIRELTKAGCKVTIIQQ